MDAKKFLEALDELEAQKGISKESIIEGLKEALKKAYIKEIDGDDDADVRIDITDGEINMFIGKTVVEEVIVDYQEISLEDAKKIDKKIKVGDLCLVPVKLEMLQRFTANAVKSILKQKIAEAEKRALYETNKDKINEMITGIVEKCDDRGAVVNIGRATVYLSRRDLIGDERFEPNEPIRMYVSNVSTSEKGPMIKVSRSDPGFLKKLFEEEVREIEDGTVIIKGLARQAGVRAKIAVYSNDPNVDCVGACIGVNGIAIKKIVDQLGNRVHDKEKIDIIQYTPNEALFIIDALKPATVKYIYLSDKVAEDGKKKAIAIVSDGQLSLAIGKKGANARVACMLTGWSIDIHEEKEMANLSDIAFRSVDEVRDEEKERIKKENYERYLAQIKSSQAGEEAKPVEEKPVEVSQPVNNGIEKSKPQQILDEDLLEDVKPVEEETEKVTEPVKEEKVEEVIEPKVVRTTTTLESLEKALESDKKESNNFKATHKTGKRPHNITDKEMPHEEEEKVEDKKIVPQMDIYTKEELEDLENEDLENDYYDDDDEDIDYDEYDKYYGDDDK